MGFGVTGGKGLQRIFPVGFMKRLWVFSSNASCPFLVGVPVCVPTRAEVDCVQSDSASLC